MTGENRETVDLTTIAETSRSICQQDWDGSGDKMAAVPLGLLLLGSVNVLFLTTTICETLLVSSMVTTGLALEEEVADIALPPPRQPDPLRK